MRPGGTFAAWPLTPMVKKILIINGAIWLASALVVVWMKQSWIYEMTAMTPNRVYPGLEVWQLFTYMWVHSISPQHIIFNSLFIWMFGGVLEQAWGPKAFLKFYIFCGVGGGLAAFAVGKFSGDLVPVVGASGAALGLTVAWVIMYPNKMIYVFGVIPIRGKYFALFPIGKAALDFVVQAPGVSHAAHLGGMATAAALITGYWRPSRLYSKLRYIHLKRKLRVIQGSGSQKPPPPDGGYWH